MSDQITNEKTSKENTNLKMSAMAIAALVLGIIAMITSFIPIVNNGSAFIAILGAIFGIVGLVGIFKGKKKSKVFGIIALAINILAIIIVLATQNLYGKAINEVSSSPTKETTSSETAKVGESLTFDNGLEIAVTSVEQGLKNYDGSAICKVSIKYTNKGNKEASYNSFDWKVQDSQGAQTNSTIYSNGNLGINADLLTSGKLAPGGTTSGVLYFKGDATKVLYSANALQNTTGTWTL